MTTLGIQLWPNTASDFAREVDNLFNFLNGVSIFFTLLILALTVYFSVKYKRRSEADRPKGIHGNLPLEIFCSVVPFIVVLVIFGWGADLYFKAITPPKESMEILVTGKQWMWKIQHPSGKREINDIHVPVGVPVKITMTSEDVIHNFFVPALRMKRDAVPGRYTQLWFEADKTGEYHMFCAEYCGTEHSLMRGTMYIMEQEDYLAWTSGAVDTKGMTPAEAGKEIFTSMGCAACHASGDSQQGPSLANKYGYEQKLSDGSMALVDEDYLRESILNPTAKMVEGYLPIMPPYQGLVKEDQMTYLITYIKSLSDKGSSTPEEAAPAEAPEESTSAQPAAVEGSES